MTCAIKRIISIKEAITYKTVNIFYEGQDISNNCEYSWSTDGVCWTNWTNINSYNDICSRLTTDYYLRILISGGFDTILLNSVMTTCYVVSLQGENIFNHNFCDNDNLFNPYVGMECALLLQQQMADSVICMLGIPIYYIRIQPNTSTADFTFKEYVLHNVDSVKKTKLMIQDGTMPSSNPRLTEFDFEWETDWETELSKTQFATLFGDTAFPKKGDLVYVPMMHRMWEVNSAYDEKNEGLMWKSTTWKLALVKYNESTNVIAGEFDDFIDSLTGHTYEDVFDIETAEQERQTGATPLSSPKFAANNLYNIFMEDAVRKQYTKHDIKILPKQFNNYSNVLGKNIYEFLNDNGCVTYQKNICGDEGTLMFILDTSNWTFDTHITREILSFGEIRVAVEYNDDNEDLSIIFNGIVAHISPNESYMVHLKWNRHTFVTEMDIYPYKHRKDIPIYRLRPEMYYFDFDNPVFEGTNAFNPDFNINVPQDCQIHAYPFSMTNIKLYNRYLDVPTSVAESNKYTTTHINCVINDLARPILSNPGYEVK